MNKRNRRANEPVSWNRSANLFTTSVANIGPGERITVEIEYQETVRYENGQFLLRFPWRWEIHPGTPVIIEDSRQRVRHDAGYRPGPDASRITPPVQPPDQAS